MDCFQWYNLVHDKHSLCINDILKLNKGDILDLLILDRDVWDIVLHKQNRYRICDPIDFFKKNIGRYIHKDGLSGTLIIYLGYNEILIENFEFHVEIDQNRWYPLKNGYLPKNDPQYMYAFDFNKDIHWTEFPVSTGIGYRGPAVLKSKLELLPNIVWDDDDISGTSSND